MTPEWERIIFQLVQAGISLAFLLVGWRLGRESTDRPMFAFPWRRQAAVETPEEADPWTEAAQGGSTPGTRLDDF